MTAAESTLPVLSLGVSRTRRLPGLLIPSFSDCFFLAVLVWLFLAGASGWKALLMDGDTGWHIRTGQYILTHGQIPHQDLFSYSRPGAPWFAWEWLADVVFALLFNIAGLKAIVLFAGVTIAAISTVLLRYSLWRGANSLIALGTTLLAVGSSSMHFLARPHLFTLLLLPLSIWVLQRDREQYCRGEHGRAVWLLIPIVALWTNLHGGFAVFLCCLALLVAGSVLERQFFGGPSLVVWRYSALLAACSAATVLNPCGLRLHLHIWEYLRSGWIRNLVQEFQAPSFRNEGQMQFELLLILGLLLAGSLLAGGKITEALWLVFLAHSALTSVRHAPLFAIVAAPLLAVHLTRWWSETVYGRPRRSVGRILFQMGEDVRPAFLRTSVWAGAAVLFLSLMNAPVPWPTDFPTQAFPIGLIRRNQEYLTIDRVFTTDQWGDYLIYSFYPRQRVFIDGRSDFYGEALGREYVTLLEGSYRALPIVYKQRFQAMLLPVEWPLAELLKHEAGWTVADDDGQAILFVTSDRRRIIEKWKAGPD